MRLVCEMERATSSGARFHKQTAPIEVGRRSNAATRFHLLGISVIQGRGLEETDGAGTVPVALISEAFARANFPGENPLGHRLRSERNDGWRIIVGVVAGLNPAPPWESAQRRG